MNEMSHLAANLIEHFFLSTAECNLVKYDLANHT